MATTDINITTTGYKTVKDESTALTQRSVLKFAGAGVTAADSGGETVVTIPGAPSTVSYGLFAQTGNSPTHTGTSFGTLIDGGVGSLSVPANGFSVGDSFRIEMAGLLSAQNNNTITIRLKSNAVILADSPAFTLPQITNQVFMLSVNFTVRSIGASSIRNTRGIRLECIEQYYI